MMILDLLQNCLDTKSVAPGSTNAVKLCRFFDRVIERRYHRDHSNSFYDRRKLYPPMPRMFTDEYS